MTHDSFAYWTTRTRRVLSGKAPLGFQRRDVEVDALVPARVAFIKSELDLVERPRRLLDVGCGFGRWSAALAGHYESYRGVDVVRERIDKASEVYGAEEIGFELVPHDRVWLMDPLSNVAFTSNVIQHLPLAVAQRLLVSVSKSLCRGGRLLLWENCIDPPPRRWAPHMIPKTRQALHDVIPDADWEVLSTHTHRLTF